MTRPVRILLPLLLLAAALPLAARADEAPAALALGKTAPEANTPMIGVDGESYTIAGAKGEHGTLVVFTCNSCPWARAWQGRIAQIANTYAKRGVGVLVVNSNDPKVAAVDGFDGMKQRAKQIGLEVPYVVDATSDVARAFGATRTPEAFLFDASGKLVYHGTVDDNAHHPDQVKKHYLQDALQAVVAGHKVETAETKAFGCSIKFRKS